MKIIPEKTAEEAAEEHSIKTYLTCSEVELYHDVDVFKSGASFAEQQLEQKILTLEQKMIEFAEWLAQNVIPCRKTDNGMTWAFDSENPEISTQQLLEEFLKQDE